MNMVKDFRDDKSSNDYSSDNSNDNSSGEVWGPSVDELATKSTH